jgi:nanoRNase/pAp phosphatase (c-di-AMP/oligoRNAs hydrolase)
MALVLVAEWAGVDATLQYPGEIRHQENRALRRVLGVDCERIDHVSDLAAEAVVLVDHAEPRGFAGAEGVLPRAVVDHHPDDGEGRSFTDVRPNYGATASVVAGYCRELGARPVPPNRRASAVDADRTVPTRVATALLFAILADTDRFTAGACAADFDAAGYLHPGVDETRLERVADPQVSAAVLETRARAVVDREVRGPFAVSHVADAANADAIPQAADELVRIEGLTAAVVCGRVDDRVYLSGRSRDERVHMGRVLEAAVDGYGDGGAGGHARMGGGQLAAAAVDRRVLAERLFEALEGAEAPSVCDPVDLTPRPEAGPGSGPDPRGGSRGATPGADPAPGGVVTLTRTRTRTRTRTSTPARPASGRRTATRRSSEDRRAVGPLYHAGPVTQVWRPATGPGATGTASATASVGRTSGGSGRGWRPASVSGRTSARRRTRSTRGTARRSRRPSRTAST